MNHLKVAGVDSRENNKKMTQPNRTKMAIFQLLSVVASLNLVGRKSAISS